MAFPDRGTGFRVYEVIEMIRSGRYPNVDTIARYFECTRRTAERYIEKIRDLLAPDLIYDRKRRGYVFAEGGPDLPQFRLTEGEAAAIFLAARLMSQCRGTPYEDAVMRALQKLAYLFPKEVTLDAVMGTADWVSFRVEPLRGDERQVLENFLDLDQARAAQETVHIRYFTASRGEWNERDVDPYHLHFHDGAWYLFGFCHWRQEVKMFALDRVGVITRTGQRFEVRPDFSVEGFLKDSFRIERGKPVEVAIKFGPEQARYVRGRVWHSSQVIEELPAEAGPSGGMAAEAGAADGMAAEARAADGMAAEAGAEGDAAGQVTAEAADASAGTREAGAPVGKALGEVAAAREGRGWRGEGSRPGQAPQPHAGHVAAGADQPSGGLILRMRVGGLGEIKRWVLSFGGGAEVLEPEELREAVAEEAAKIGSLYGDDAQFPSPNRESRPMDGGQPK